MAKNKTEIVKPKPPACDSSFDVVYWFIDTALDDGEYLQPQKLHRLLYLAQAYHLVAFYGQMLMPAIFVCEDMGPIEPQVYRALEQGRPVMDLRPIPEQTKHFLSSVWRRFGAHTGDYLSNLIRNHPPFFENYRNGRRTPISLKDMMDYYSKPVRPRKDGKIMGEAAPGVDKVLRPRVLRSQHGKPVSVSQWMPTRQSKKNKKKQ